MKTSLIFLILIGFTSLFAADPTDGDAIHQIYPQLAPTRDFALKTDGSLGTWKIKNKRFPQPTAAQIAAVKTQLVAQRTSTASLQASLLAQFSALKPGEQVSFEAAFTHVKVLLAVGKVSDAKTLLATLPVPDSLTAARAAMVALFPQ